MRIVQTLIFIGCISFTGFTAYAQFQGILSTDSMRQTLESGGISSGNVSLSNILEGMRDVDTIVEPVLVIEGPLVIEDVTPDTNQVITEIIDTRTGRYPPRLKINFAEYPLRSLTRVGRTESKSNVETTVVATITKRVENRLRLSQFNIVVEDRTAIVSGTVSTERQRSLVESMLHFEPGIDAVQNKLTVIPPELQ